MSLVSGPGRRAYRGVWSVLVRWFRVPETPPTLPVEPGEPIEAFGPDPGFLSYLLTWFWLVVAIVASLALVAIGIVTVASWGLGAMLAPVLLVTIAPPKVLAFLAVHLRFDTTWYVMTARSLRIRRGIWVIHETTLTFENVQNVKVTQGPLQRLFGIANVVLETAGGSGDGRHGTGVSNRGVVEGIRDPHRLRDVILARLRASQAAGLGDEDVDLDRPWPPEHLAVLREVRAAVAALAGR